MTPDQKRGLDRLKLRWPERRLVLERMSEFQLLELCADYEIASVALAVWTHKSGPNALRVVDEYQRLIRELEDELETLLRERQS